MVATAQKLFYLGGNSSKSRPGSCVGFTTVLASKEQWVQFISAQIIVEMWWWFRRTLTRCPCCRPGTASHDHLWSAVVPQFAVGAGHAASPPDLRRGCALRLHQVLRQPTATPACQVRHQCLRPRVGKAGKSRSDVRTLDLSTHTHFAGLKSVSAKEDLIKVTL